MSPYLYIPRAYIRNDVMFMRNPLRRRVAKFSHLAREDMCTRYFCFHCAVKQIPRYILRVLSERAPFDKVASRCVFSSPSRDTGKLQKVISSSNSRMVYGSFIFFFFPQEKLVRSARMFEAFQEKVVNMNIKKADSYRPGAFLRK